MTWKTEEPNVILLVGKAYNRFIMIKQIVGFALLIIFLSFLGNKLYNALIDVEYGSLILYICALVVILVVVGVGRQLRDY